MKINCIIIHGSPPSKDLWIPIGDKKRWITWIKNVLENLEIKTFTPDMPKPWQPIYQDWKEAFEKLPIQENTILIGHSAGGAFLVRWLGDNEQKIKKLILVAPGKNIGDYPNAEHNRELYDFEVNPKLKERVNEITIFTSPEEPTHRKNNVELYKKILGAKVISLEGRGHFVFKSMGTNEFPELLNEILK